MGTLRLTIPWKRLKSEPAVIRLEDLFILVAPRSSSDSDKDARKQRERKIKRRNLQLAELMGAQGGAQAEPEPAADSGGYFSSYVSLIVNNLQIYIDRVHIRYEDAASNPQVHSPPSWLLHALTSPFEEPFCDGNHPGRDPCRNSR